MNKCLWKDCERRKNLLIHTCCGNKFCREHYTEHVMYGLRKLTVIPQKPEAKP